MISRYCFTTYYKVFYASRANKLNIMKDFASKGVTYILQNIYIYINKNENKVLASPYFYKVCHINSRE